MAWVRIDDDFAQHPKVAAAGPLAMAMQLAALCYCNRNLTDGFIPRAIANTLVDWEMVDAKGEVHTIAFTSGMSGNDVTCAWVIGFLIEAGMWSEEPKGYRIHDYLDYQPSSAKIKQVREQTKQRVRKWRNASSNAVGNAPCNAPVTPAPVPVPVPSKKKDPSGPKKDGSARNEKPKVGLNDLTAKDFIEFGALKAPNTNILLEIERFGDYCRSRGKRYKDYPATFRNWLRKAQEFHDERKGDAGGNGAAVEISPEKRLESKAWHVKKGIRTTAGGDSIITSFDLDEMVEKSLITQEQAEAW